MKKIFILGLLLPPIMAHATDPVGPSAVGQGETPVVATVSAPYATATAENGDTTNVVSASYVKGAYNDAIAAVNKVADDKQAKLLNGSNNHNIESKVVAGSIGVDYVTNYLSSVDDYNITKPQLATNLGIQSIDDALVSADVFFKGLLTRQSQLTGFDTGDVFTSDVISANYIDNLNHSVFDNNGLTNVNSDLSNEFVSADQVLMSAGGVFYLVNGAKEYTDDKRVNAVTTWGSNTVTKVPLVNQ